MLYRYRHPNCEMFVDDVLETQKKFYLLEDSFTWLKYLEAFGLIQKVRQPTRKTLASETLIDYIYCNIDANVSAVDVPQ